MMPFMGDLRRRYASEVIIIRGRNDMFDGIVVDWMDFVAIERECAKFNYADGWINVIVSFNYIP